MSNEQFLLAGDIGATKIDLAVISTRDWARKPRHEATFQVDAYPGPAALFREYLAAVPELVTAACFGVAGPVIEDRVQMVNHEWVVDAAALSAEFGWRKVWLLNDLKAAAHAVPGLPDEELDVLNPGQPEAGGNIAVIAPGTGLGQGYLTWDGKGYVAHATEGGHSDFAPNGSIQRELLEYLAAERTQVSVEDVCSGIGMPNIYNFLRDSGQAKEPAWLAEQLAAAEDPTPLIFDSAMSVEMSAEISKKALEIFVNILGSEAGNLALKIGATGGLFVGGGIPPRILSVLKQGAFLKAFLSKEKYTDYMRRIPVKVILNPDSALLGAAAYGLEQFERL